MSAFALLALTQATIAQSAPKTSHLLALAACPPWKAIKGDPKKTKEMADSCQHDVDTIIPALRKSFAIDASNVTTRLNKDADFSGVSQAIKALAARAKPEDRVVIYLNFHGGKVNTVYRGDPVKDEVIATYTTDEPSDFVKAVANNEWMSVKELRNLVDLVQAHEIIVIIEACESTAGLHDFRFNMAGRYAKNWNGREAVIFSSRANQAAAYNESGSTALFTETFAKRLTAATHGNIRDIFHTSALETHRTLRATCLKDETAADLKKKRTMYADACTQMPEAYDPYGLLDDIQAINGKTVVSAWQKIQDDKSAVAKKKTDAASSQSTASAKSSSTTVTSKEKGTGTSEDPFAWAKPLFSPPTYAPSGFGVPYGYAPINYRNQPGTAR